MITIVDYGMGNIGSILNMLKRIGSTAAASSSPSDIEIAESLILPGVGAFDTGMRNLAAAGLIPVLTDRVRQRHVPILGICLGMQLMTCGSEEGDLPGLSWLEARTVRFRFDGMDPMPKIPHMGWNTVTPRNGSRLFSDVSPDCRFYFVHSYHVVCNDQQDVAANCHYGYDFTASAERGNVFGTQFHPEKSHKFGLELLRGFVSVTQSSGRA